jgi:hypothetical protein
LSPLTYYLHWYMEYIFKEKIHRVTPLSSTATSGKRLHSFFFLFHTYALFIHMCIHWYQNHLFSITLISHSYYLKSLQWYSGQKSWKSLWKTNVDEDVKLRKLTMVFQGVTIEHVTLQNMQYCFIKLFISFFMSVNVHVAFVICKNPTNPVSVKVNNLFCIFQIFGTPNFLKIKCQKYTLILIH